ncbi:SOS response-associated peptidase [Azorhizobium sp. AG788]|uniref:SOS response-associated peptidase n=1 Tax=Azorhizobium sp. AG788 TaxID=2183897 RepID=UPI003139EAC5
MCGRFVQHQAPVFYAAQFGLDTRDVALPNAPARFNVAPTQDVMVIRHNPESRRAELSLLRWGLVPSWAKDLKIGASMINARSETVAEKPAFKAAWNKPRRCVVPVDAFYEWQRTDGGKQPYAIALKGGAPMGFAGLWEGWKDPATGAWVRTFTILTCAANALMAPLHDRMPVILARDDMDRWLTGPDPRDLLKPYAPEQMELWPVSSRVNSVRNEDADLLVPVAL